MNGDVVLEAYASTTATATNSISTRLRKHALQGTVVETNPGIRAIATATMATMASVRPSATVRKLCVER